MVVQIKKIETNEKPDDLVNAYLRQKREYEQMEKTDHPEYLKIVEWLKSKDIIK